jgi:hypothetical protein
MDEEVAQERGEAASITTSSTFTDRWRCKRACLIRENRSAGPGRVQNGQGNRLVLLPSPYRSPSA